MLMRRATASVLFRTQVVLVYLQFISAKIHSNCTSLPKIANNRLKLIFLGFKVVQGHRCWYPREARQQCLLWYAASLCLMSICNHSRARLVDSSKNRTFSDPYITPICPSLNFSFWKKFLPSTKKLGLEISHLWEFRAKIVVLSTRNLLCRTYATSYPQTF